jgi:hypothetical protein
MDKTGELIDPLHIIVNGSTHLHAVQSGVLAIEPDSLRQVRCKFHPFFSLSLVDLMCVCVRREQLSIESTDVALASFGAPSPFPTPLSGAPDMSLGVSYNLYNNVWGNVTANAAAALGLISSALSCDSSCLGTNYIMWYPFAPEDANSQFRFSLS